MDDHHTDIEVKSLGKIQYEAQGLRALASLTEDWSSVLSINVGWLEPPLTPTPGHLIPSSGFHSTVHTQCTYQHRDAHTYIKIQINLEQDPIQSGGGKKQLLI